MYRTTAVTRLAALIVLPVATTPGLADRGALERVPFDSDRWEITSGAVVEHLGRTALTGTALLRDVEFTNGIIEVDIATSGARAYPGLAFSRTVRSGV